MARYQHFLTQVTTLSASAQCLLGNALREWPIECLVPSVTGTPSCDNELNGVQILLESFATECEAIAIEEPGSTRRHSYRASGDAAFHR